MSDLEGLARNLLNRKVNRRDAVGRLIQEILDFKEVTPVEAEEMAAAVIGEVEASSKALEDTKMNVLTPISSGVTMGEQGVGCRGMGDFFVHRLVAQLSYGEGEVVLSPQDMDDAGAIEVPEGRYLVAKMEGMHSRLSDFPFLAGFHVTRAAFRDLYVKGAVPVGLLVDIHLADDADVGKLLDFMAGVASVCELVKCPVLGGSTLRIGGDMVIGSRMTGGIAAIGVAKRLLPRRDVQKGDAIIMTEGAGGGTICTTAIYSGHPEIVRETLNLKFLTASRTVLESRYLSKVHCMADVTNGGIRADLYEISSEAGCGAQVNEEVIASLTNQNVKSMLDENGIDFLGVSLDSLLIFVEEEAVGPIIDELSRVEVMARVIGKTTEGREVWILRRGGVSELLPRFRESAYTEVKKVVNSKRPSDVGKMELDLRSAAALAHRRKRTVVDMLRKNSSSSTM